MPPNDISVASPPRLDGATNLRQWLSVFAVALSAFAFVTCEVLPVGLLPQIARDLGVTPGVAGLTVSMPGVMAAFFAPASLILAGRTDRRLVFLLLTGMLLGSNIVSAASTSLVMMLVGRALLGAALGGFWTLAIAAASRLVTPQNAAKAIAIILAGVTFATVIGAPLGTFIATLASWRASFLATGGLAATALIAQTWFVPPMPSPVVSNIGNFAKLLRRGHIQLSLLMVALVFGSHFLTFTYIAPLLQQDFSVNEMTLLLLAFGVTGFISNAMLAMVVAKRLKAAIAGLTLLLLGAIALMVLFQHSRVVEGASILVWGIALGALPLSFSVWIQRSAADMPEAGSALFVCVIQATVALGSALGGMIVDRMGVPVDFMLGGTFAVLGLLVLRRLMTPVGGAVDQPAVH